MSQFVETLRALGPLGLLILSSLDGAGLPIVGGVDALLIFVSSTRPVSAYASAAMATLGSWAGSLVLFYLARKGGEAYLDQYSKSRRAQRFRHWFLEYGLLTVFVTAVIPIIPTPLKIFVLSAGALGVSPMVFSAVFVLARAIRYFSLALLTARHGRQTLPYLKSHIWELAALGVGLFLILLLLVKLADRRHKLERLVSDSQ